MTLDGEEEEEAAAREGDAASQFAERVSGALDHSGQLTQVRSNDNHPGGAVAK